MFVESPRLEHVDTFLNEVIETLSPRDQDFLRYSLQICSGKRKGWTMASLAAKYGRPQYNSRTMRPQLTSEMFYQYLTESQDALKEALRDRGITGMGDFEF